MNLKFSFVWLISLIYVVGDLFLSHNIDWIVNNFNSLRFLANFIISYLFVSSIFFLLNIFFKKFSTKVVLLILFAIPLFFQSSYYATFNKFIEPFVFDALIESPEMILKTGLSNINYLNSILITLFTIGFIVLIRKLKIDFSTLKNRIIYILSLIVILGSLVYSLFSWFYVAEYSNSSFAFVTSFVESFLIKQSVYSRKVDRIDISPKNSNKYQIIWVIGESQVLSHMSLWGYNRKTTPKLDSLYNSGVVIKYNNMTSVGNKTRLSIPYMLTGLMGPDPNGIFYKYPNIFNYAKKAGYVTGLISAQDFSWGNFDKIIVDKDIDKFYPGTHFSNKVDVHVGADDMVVLRDGVVPFLKKYRDSSFLLVIQMNGSHYPYSKHSPKWIKKYLPEETPNSINAFDNTIIYTDLYLSNLINIAKQILNKPSLLFFTPDHGQEFDKSIARFNDNFSKDVIHNAFFIANINRADSLLNPLKKNINQPTTQADIFATICSLLGYNDYAKSINGLSLFNSIDSNRIRVCSGYMPTFHNNPVSAIIPNIIDSAILVNNQKKTFKKYSWKESKPFELLPEIYLNTLNNLLSRE